MRCVITGGAGFIGSHLVDALVQRGDAVTVLDDLSTGRRENLDFALTQGASLRVIDIGDEAALGSVMAEARPELVFHLAARVDVRRSVERPGEDAAANVLGTIGVLEAACRVGARRLINSSSGGAVYGDAELIPTPEEHRARPISPYGQGKFAAEGYCELYARSRGLSSLSLRYSNVYGPRQDARLEGGVVAVFCGAMTEGRVPVVFGDGRQTRDWVEVSDVVRANLLAADSDVLGAINIATGRETSVLDLVDELGIAVGGRLGSGVTFAPERAGEVRRSCLDIARARNELGWEPTVSLRQGLQKVLGRLRQQAAAERA